ncbi:MAG: hypothetical protein GC149_10410 [Gammaproteobacteria bacterium]|nr:hypothetical protein [Gammaproteobacteria bacterium]
MLLLTAPAQHNADNPAVECDPRRVKQWLSELPTDDVQSTVGQLLAVLKPFNELQLELKSRLKLLEIYHAAFETILYTYDELHLRTLALSHEQRHHLSDDIMWVYLELANGYKSIVKAVYEGSQDAPAQGDILLAIYRGIELIANALIYTFRDHRTPPPLAYLEIHQLYALAEEYQLATQTITALSNKSHRTSIQHLYKQIMLLIAADAYAYNGSQISELYQLLDKYSNSSVLLAQLTADTNITGFFIDFHEDKSPRGCGRITQADLSPTQRVLQIDGVLQAIVADLNKEKGVALDSLRANELRLLRMFVNNLQQGSRGRETRKPISGNVRVAYAVDASCYYLEHRDRFVETDVEAVSGIEVRDIDIFEAEHELTTWQIVNATNSGLRLASDAESVGHFVVGEMVSVMESISATREPLISTGLIRWLRYIDDKIHMGVEILPGMPMAVSCQAVTEDEDDPIAFSGLYFPSNQNTKQPASLLFEFNQFRYAKKFQVEVSGRRYCIEPARLLKESPVHVQFGFRIING